MHATALKFQQRARVAGLDVEPQELSDSTRTAAEAAAAVGCELGQIVKSVLLVDGGGDPLLCLCAGDRRIDLESLGEGVGMARGREVKELTGYAIGGVPPLGHDRPVRTVVDRSLQRFETVWCAAGTPNTVFEVRLDELLAAVPGAELRDV
jgi:prolyl-tRNA editing enzyme YbaK/EbsC (Cys-tRNA(Pro) deacylase)